MAEEMGLLEIIGEWVLEELSRQSRTWRDRGMDLSVSFNLSPRQLYHRDLAEKVLRSVSTRDREILTRFYLMEQTQAEICEEMGLSETQFRLLKSRAKARFGELGKKRLARGHFV